MFGYSPAAFRESGITNIPPSYKDLPSGGLDGLSDKWHVGFANTLVALTMIVRAHVEMLRGLPGHTTGYIVVHPVCRTGKCRLVSRSLFFVRSANCGK